MELEKAESFQVVWDNPEDAQGFWVVDIIHCPTPISRLDFDLRMRPMLWGTNQVYEHYGVPIRLESRLIHGYIYQKLLSMEIPAEAIPGVLNSADAAVRQVGRALSTRWEDTWLPEIQSHLDALTAFDLGGASLPALLAHVEDAERRIRRLWQVHTELLTPVLVALSDFDEAYRDLFPDARPLDVYELLSGLPNKTVEANLRLWDMGRGAAQSPSVRALFTTRAPAELPARLAESPEGRGLWSEIQTYVRTYGERNDDLYIDKPTWIDDPTPVLRGLREAVVQSARDLTAELQQLAGRRLARIEEVRAAIVSYPRPVIDEFEALLKAAQTATVLSEDHHFWIDCKITHHARRLALEVGSRLAACGALEGPDDVFHLSMAELSAMGDPAEAAPRLRALVAERRAEAARFAGVTPPIFLGVPRPILPMDCAILRAGHKFSGNMFSPPGDPGELKGMPGSRGQVTGRVRVVRTPSEAERLEPGDILVAPFTLPSWTPFFASASGVVTNIGGMLCHAAVVAREYAIPAVVGTQRATDVLRDGQLIEVDGDAGVVRILAS